MPYIHSKGSPSSDTWVIVDRPLSKDIEKGYIYSSGLGYLWDSIMRDAGFSDYYVTAYRPDTDHANAFADVDGIINQYKPRIIIPLDAVGQKLCPELKQVRRKKTYNEDTDSEIFKYAGSPLKSPYLKYDHWVYPTLSPDLVTRQYKIRDQVVLDCAKAYSELEYAKTNGVLQPGTKRILRHQFESFDEILYELDKMFSLELVSNDIETVYFKKASKSQFYGKHPGYPIILALANSPFYGISIDIFREKDSETVELWRKLDRGFRNTITLGQNFISFDANFYESLGFRFRQVVDTLLLHHLLWPELPHKLQHLTRQYTREPYYKDENAGATLKNRTRWKIYNAKDACVTLECYLEMLKELELRPHLK